MPIIPIAMACAVTAQADLPLITVTEDDTVIDRSCRVNVPKGVFIQDLNDNGVIHIKADDITVEFIDREAELIAAPPGTPWETLGGIGIIIDGHTNVTLINAHSHRFKIGILATNADGLTLDNCDVAGGYAMKLTSTPEAEGGGDWLWPHHNDDHQWRDRYGAGICIENSKGVTVKDCYARRRQNGLILDRVTDSRIYDNDFSFLSGWGIAMWRSSDNIIARNALDFCVRGYSHGVYNRGQDSAGLLMFEQCHRNTVAENSITHGGDGVFGFGGADARGDNWLNEERARLRRELGRDDVDNALDPPDELVDFTRRNGCNDNLFIANDLSYAPAHGLEMTFSFGNKILVNRIVANAICGIWGGYSQETVIAGNVFELNGEYGYGLERGGVNIEHGYDNTVQDNDFIRNRCGVHFWWDPDPHLTVGPWAEANHHPAPSSPDRILPSYDNYVIDNRFSGDQVALHLRDADRTVTASNVFEEVNRVLDVTPGSEPVEVGMTARWGIPEHTVLGDRRPVGARSELRGRENIIMGRYFPWDFQSEMLRVGAVTGTGIVYEAFGFDDAAPEVTVEGDVSVTVVPAGEGRYRIAVDAPPGVHPFKLTIPAGRTPGTFEGTLIASDWQITVFPWKIDPREDLEAWRALAKGDNARTVHAGTLNLAYAMGGPVDVLDIESDTIGGDRFGTIASTRLPLTAGRWRIRTNSDDGVRVLVDGEPVIDNWTWHAPTTDEGFIDLPEPRAVEIVVEHFEIDGYAILELDLERVD